MSGGCIGNSAAFGRSARRTATVSARCWCCTTCALNTSVDAPGEAGGRNTLPQLLPDLRADIEREIERLALVARQIRTLETMQARQVRNGAQPAIAGLARLAGIGTGSAWTLVKELFGWRRFANRRELAGCLGLAPTPYASGTSEVEQGISKAGNKRVRWLMVELAWSWLRFQPASELSKWFNQRFGGAGKR